MNQREREQRRERRVQRFRIERVKELYEIHDQAEAVLLYLERHKMYPSTFYGAAWTFHDALERKIIVAEAELPRKVVAKLKTGEL